jgi:outer membrane protein assembly factor BamB
MNPTRSTRHAAPAADEVRPSRRSACGAAAGAAVLVAGWLVGTAHAGNWPTWRGPQGTGVVAAGDEPNLPLTWGEKENVRWRTPLPDRGNSTPVVWGDRVFVTQATEKDDRRTVMCFARADGCLLWQAGVAYADGEPTNGQNPYCAASPATDGKRVIAYFGSAGLVCYDLDGKELWRRDVGKVDSWQGSGSSPVLHGDLCILNAGPGTDAALIAMNKETGAVVWKVVPPATPAKPATAEQPKPAEPRKAGAAKPRAAGGGFDDAMRAADPRGAGGYLGSWSTPVVIRPGDRDELIVVHALQVTAYDPATGKELWTCKGLPEQAFASPAIGDGMLVATGHRVTGGGTRVTAVKLSPGMTGDVTETHRLWQADLPKDCVGSGVIAAGHVFLPTQFGSVACYDLRTGKRAWDKRLEGSGAKNGTWSSLVLAGDRLLIPNHSGQVFVLRASPKFEVLATNVAAEETTCASLAASDGQVFLRTYDALWCFGIGK